MNYYAHNKKNRFNIIELSRPDIYPAVLSTNPYHNYNQSMTIVNTAKQQQIIYTNSSSDRKRYLVYNSDNQLDLWHENAHRKITICPLYCYLNNFNSICLTIATIFVVFVVLMIASLAVYLSSYHFYGEDESLIAYVGSFRVSRGDIYTKALDDFTSNVHKEKIQKYKQLIEAVYKRSAFGLSLKTCHIDGFRNNTLIVNFTLLLNTSLIPKYFKDTEKSLKDVLIKDLMSKRSIFRNIKIDMKTIRFRKLMKNELFNVIDDVTRPTQGETNDKNHLKIYSDMPVIQVRSNNTVTQKTVKIGDSGSITDLDISRTKYQVKDNNHGHLNEHIFSYGDVEVINSTVQELLEESKVAVDYVTLLPAKSNSGIIQLKDKIRNRFAENTDQTNSSNGRYLSSSRLFNPIIATPEYTDNTEIVTSISSELQYFSIPKRQHKIIDSSLHVKYRHTSQGIVNSSDCSQNASHILCDDGKCLPKSAKCNQIIECSNQTDEKFCTCADYLRNQFLSRKICDGVIDCLDYSDEHNCDWCSPNKYICFNSKVCIRKNQICDGNMDCPNGDDEKNCLTIAANSKLANQLTYMSKGYLMIRKHGIWGKICIGSLNESVSKFDSMKHIGKYVCKLMTYKNLKSVRPVKVVQKIENEYYFELINSNHFKDRPKTNNNLSLAKKNSCFGKSVLEIQCLDLKCGTRPKAIIKSNSTNGRQYRIVGGTNSNQGSWPWHVALYKEGEYQCGASLISEFWLISAGHCVYHSQDNYWVARMGISRRGSTFVSPYEQSRRICKIVLHPDYIDSGFLNDISVLKMATAVQFNDFIRPICLPSEDEDSLYNGRLCTVIGWGQLYETGRIFPDTLQELQLPIISSKECQRRTKLLSLYHVTDNMFCAGYDRGGRDACLGDSGGPLMCPDENFQWFLYGITSNGYGCARAYKPGVYTKISKYLKWIHSQISNNNRIENTTLDSCKGHRCPLGECLPKSSICNRYIECSNQSDEQDCV